LKQHIAHIALLVREYDEAIDFYVNKLNFTLLEDTTLTESKRWVLVAPPGSIECKLLLARAVGSEQLAQVGKQSGGRVFLFLYTDSFTRDFQNLIDHNIRIVRAPSQEPYGTVAVFADLYGNLWDLIEPKK
jgi:catechol 2,3-dioxygenase-like lactoylglutathione lyase family enzyme